MSSVPPHSPSTPAPEARGTTGPALRRPALALAVIAALLAGCTATGLTDDRVDYGKSTQRKTPLDVPPDLTQISRDPRFQPQGGAINATRFDAAAQSPSSPLGTAAGTGNTVAPADLSGMRIERDGSQRWLITQQTPEEVWPKLRSFWERSGFTLVVDQPETGVMETEWAENRAKIPQDIIRRTIGRALDSLYSTGERDKYRTRVERAADGTEIFISHRGVEEVYSDRGQSSTVWQPRASDPSLEGEMLSRLRLALAGEPQAPAGAASAGADGGDAQVAAAEPAASEVPASTSRARVLDDQPGAALRVDESFDRAWRRVGLALDRGGFTVEDRDRSGGLYFVRYIDPTDVGKSEPGFFSRLFGGGGEGPTGPLRYRIALKPEGDATNVSVLDQQGAPASGTNAQRIVTQLVNELR